jgi:hypothetical protein
MGNKGTLLLAYSARENMAKDLISIKLSNTMGFPYQQGPTKIHTRWSIEKNTATQKDG